MTQNKLDNMVKDFEDFVNKYKEEDDYSYFVNFILPIVILQSHKQNKTYLNSLIPSSTFVRNLDKLFAHHQIININSLFDVIKLNPELFKEESDDLDYFVVDINFETTYNKISIDNLIDEMLKEISNPKKEILTFSIKNNKDGCNGNIQIIDKNLTREVKFFKDNRIIFSTSYYINEKNNYYEYDDEIIINTFKDILYSYEHVYYINTLYNTLLVIKNNLEE